MNIKEFLDKVCHQIKYEPASKPISEELEAHMTELKKENICKGISEEQAEIQAVEQMGNPTQIGKILNKIHRPKLDWKLVFLIFILICFRVILYMSDYNTMKLENNIKYTLISLAMIVGIYFLDYRKTKNISKLMYLIATGILVFQWINAYYFSIGKSITGSTMNIRLWNISIPLYIIAFAGDISKYKKEKFWNIIIFYILSCVFIYWQSASMTNTIILILSYLSIIGIKILQNNKKSYGKVFMIYTMVLSMAIISMILMNNIKIPYLFYGETAEELYNINVYEKTQRYESEILQNIKWIGFSNGLEMTPDLNTSQFKFLYLLGTLGILPAVLLVLTIILMGIRLIKDTKNIKDAYGKYLIIGLSTTYIVQSVIHVLMNLNLWIRSDVNLPFVTEGNLYLLINCFTFAVILSVYRRKDINFEEPKKSKWAERVENYFFEEC